MHKIRFRLGLCPRSCWGSSQRSLRLTSWILGGPTSKGKEGREKERAWERRGGVKRRGAGREGKKGRGREGKGDEPPIEISGYATAKNLGFKSPKTSISPKCRFLRLLILWCNL